MEAGRMRRSQEGDPERELDHLLGTLGFAVRQDDLVLDLGCRLTGPLAERAAHVIALGVSRDELLAARERSGELNNVTWLLGDGESLAGVEDVSLDGAVAPELLRALPDAKRALGYVAELGRVLKPGAWAAFGLSTDPRAEGPPEPPGTSRRDLLRGLAGRRPQPHRRLGAAVPLDALGAVATSAGLILEDIDGAGTRETVVRAVATGTRAGGSTRPSPRASRP